MFSRKMFTVLSLIVTLVLASSVSVLADELPEDMSERAKERIRELPEEVQKRLIQAWNAHKAAEGTDSAEPSDEESDEEAESEEPEEKDEAKEEEKQEPSPKDEMNERLKKIKAEMQAMETEFQYKVAKYKHELEEQRFLVEKLKLDNQLAAQLREQQDTEQKDTLAELKKQTDILAC